MLSLQNLDVYRAAASLPLHVAEGHDDLARASAMACAALIDGLYVVDHIRSSQHRVATDLLDRILAMLSAIGFEASPDASAAR